MVCVDSFLVQAVARLDDENKRRAYHLFYVKKRVKLLISLCKIGGFGHFWRIFLIHTVLNTIDCSFLYLFIFGEASDTHTHTHGHT